MNRNGRTLKEQMQDHAEDMVATYGVRQESAYGNIYLIGCKGEKLVARDACTLAEKLAKLMLAERSRKGA